MSGMAEDAQSQRPVRVPAGFLGAGESCVEEVEGLLEIFPQTPAHGGQGDATAGAVEQGHAEEAFLLTDGLTDTGPGDMQPFGGAAEVQFFRQRQKDLDVT